MSVLGTSVTSNFANLPTCQLPSLTSMESTFPFQHSRLPLTAFWDLTLPHVL